MKTILKSSRLNLTILSLTLLFLSIFSFSINAQNRLSFELRGNASIPTKDLGVTQLKSGFGFEGTLGNNHRKI